MASRVRLTMARGADYDLSLTDELLSNLNKLRQGYIPGSNFLAVSETESINLNQLVGFNFYDDESTSEGGHVYEAAKADLGWTPDQTGGVVTAEPDMVTRARKSGQVEPTDIGGDM